MQNTHVCASRYGSGKTLITILLVLKEAMKHIHVKHGWNLYVEHCLYSKVVLGADCTTLIEFKGTAVLTALCIHLQASEAFPFGSVCETCANGLLLVSASLFKFVRCLTRFLRSLLMMDLGDDGVNSGAIVNAIALVARLG